MRSIELFGTEVAPAVRAELARKAGLDAGELARTGFRSRPGREAPPRHHVSMPPMALDPRVAHGAHRPAAFPSRSSPRWRSARSWSPSSPRRTRCSSRRRRTSCWPRRSTSPRSRRTAWGSPTAAPRSACAERAPDGEGTPVGAAGRRIRLRRRRQRLPRSGGARDLRWRRDGHRPRWCAAAERCRRRAALRGHRCDRARGGDRGEEGPGVWLPDIVATPLAADRATRWSFTQARSSSVSSSTGSMSASTPSRGRATGGSGTTISTRARASFASPRRQFIVAEADQLLDLSTALGVRRATFAWQAPALTEPPITLEDA